MFSVASAFVRPILRRLRQQAGMSVLETMVAAVILSAGILGVFVMVEVSDNINTTNRGRETANSLAREVLETARATPFQEIGATNWFHQTLTDLEGRKAPVSSPSWSAETKVERRGVTYDITVDTCSVDDVQDGYGSTHPATVNWCTADTFGTGTDGKPEDMKRVAVTLTWAEGTKTFNVYQTAMFSSTGQVVGPTLSSLNITAPSPINQDAPVITSGSSVTFQGMATGAADMKFTVDGVEQTTGVTGGNGTWDFNWNIVPLKDGVYTIGAIAVDSLGTRGAPMVKQVTLARGAPTPVTNATGGYNDVFASGATKRVVELGWDASPEGNVTGYEVLKGATPVCSASLNLECMDLNPASSGTTVYTIKTLYTDAGGNAGWVSTTYSVTAPAGGGTLPTQYGITDTTVNTDAPSTGPCTNYWNTARDLSPTWPTTGGTNVQIGGNISIMACTAPMASTTTLAAGTVTGRMYFTNTSNKSCSLAQGRVYIAETQTQLGPMVAVSPAIPASIATPTLRTFNITVPATTIQAGQRLQWNQQTGSGVSACSGVKLNFGSGTYQSTVTFPSLTSSGGGGSLTKPSAPTGLTVTPDAAGNRVLQWSRPASSTPAVEFYRIYRDGQNYTERIDTLGETGTGTLEFVDTTAGGTSHTYRVTSVAATMVESSQLGPVTG